MFKRQMRKQKCVYFVIFLKVRILEFLFEWLQFEINRWKNSAFKKLLQNIQAYNSIRGADEKIVSLLYVQVTSAIQGYEPSLFSRHQESLFILLLFSLVRLLSHFPSVFLIYFLYSDSIRKWILYVCNSLLQCIILRSGGCNCPAVLFIYFVNSHFVS